MKAKNLPLDTLLDALAHLTPADIDRSLRFVSYKYRSLVEKYGGTHLPKHTISLHSGAPPAEASRPAPYTSCIGWFSFGGDRKEEEEEKNSHKMGINEAWVRALLADVRLGRVHLITLTEVGGGGKGEKSAQLEKFERFLILLHHRGEEIEARGPVCVQVHHHNKASSYRFPQSLRHYVHHLSLGSSSVIYNILREGHPRRRLIFHITSTNNRDREVMYLLHRIVHPSFPYSQAPTASASGVEPFIGEDLLIFGSLPSMDLVQILGQPAEETSRRVDHWLEDTEEEEEEERGEGTSATTTTAGDCGTTPAYFRHYYRRLEGREWMVWRLRNWQPPSPLYFEGASATIGQQQQQQQSHKVDNKYLRVMQAVVDDDGDGHLSGIHVRMFDASPPGRQRAGHRA